MIWRQTPKVDGRGHYGHRIAFGPDGFLYISSGERQKFTPAQDLQQNLGKIVRLNDDGSVPADNPFAERGGVTAQIWSLGHRNPLGLAFDAQGQLWNVEMGPMGGDELNRVQRGANYGYPIVSNGDHYGGADIPGSRHAARPRGARGVLESRDLAVEPAVLQRQRVSGLAGRRVHRRALVDVDRAHRVRCRRHGARGRALPHAAAHARLGAGARWRDLGARGRPRRAFAEAHGGSAAPLTLWCGCRFRIGAIFGARTMRARSQRGDRHAFRRTSSRWLAGVATAGLAGLAAAHHSQVGIFDSQAEHRGHGRHQVDLVAQSARADPADETNADGTTTEWDAETASIAVMRNRGAEPSAVVVGDRVTIAGAPIGARPQRDPRAQHAAVVAATSSRSAARRRTSPKARAAASSAARRSKPTSRKRRRKPTASSASGRRS